MRIIAGCARGRALKTRKGMETRPTADRVKESLFNILANRIEGSRFLDIFAGNGGIGIEALSRGAEKCVFIEKNNHCVTIIKDNLALTGLNRKGAVIAGDAAAAVSRLKKDGEVFDIIFLDPPYHSPDLPVVAAKIAESGILDPQGLLVVEHHRHDISWRGNPQWDMAREKQYGDTTISFFKPAAAGGDSVLPDKGGDENGDCHLPG